MRLRESAGPTTHTRGKRTKPELSCNVAKARPVLRPGPVEVHLRRLPLPGHEDGPAAAVGLHVAPHPHGLAA